jgi:hypothetical protein
MLKPVSVVISHLESKMITLKDSAEIVSSLKGKDANVSLRADIISLSDNASIRSIQYGSENADISIIANEMIVLDSAQIDVFSYRDEDTQTAVAGTFT